MIGFGVPGVGCDGWWSGWCSSIFSLSSLNCEFGLYFACSVDFSTFVGSCQIFMRVALER